MNEALKRELDGVLPSPLAALDDPAQGRLAMQIAAAKARQQQRLGAEIDEALRHIPALLRGPIRRLFD